jgi:phage tail-like protein
MPTYYPPVGFHFRVEFGFLPQETNDSLFQEVSGISAEVGLEELQEGGENRFAHRLPTKAKYSNLILKRGLFINSELIDWVRNAIENISATDVYKPTTVNVTLLNEEGEPLKGTYSFINAWPIKWSVSDFKAMGNAMVVESLELTYNYFRLSK